MDSLNIVCVICKGAILADEGICTIREKDATGINKASREKGADLFVEAGDTAQPFKLVKIEFSSKITKFGPKHEKVPFSYGLIKNVVVRSGFGTFCMFIWGGIGMQKCKNGFCTNYFRVQPYIDWTNIIKSNNIISYIT